MRAGYTISTEGQDIIQQFINTLSSNEQLHTKTLIEYTGDLKHFINWFECEAYPSEDKHKHFHPLNVRETTLTYYREAIQYIMELKPATINRRLITLKRFFEWAAQHNVIALDPSKHVKLVPTEKVCPRQMTDTEESELITSVILHGTIRDQTILMIMLRTGLCTMEICDLAPNDIFLNDCVGHITVRFGKRKKQREVPLDTICLTALEKYLAQIPADSPFVFTSEKTKDRLCERALRYIIQKYMKLAQLEDLSSHDLRHRFGYKMAQHMTPEQLAQIMGLDNTDTPLIYMKAARKDLVLNPDL